MSKKPTNADQRAVIVLDYETLRRVNELAARYGIDPEEVVLELVRLEMIERSDDVTLH